jgi:type II secretory pathway predicted ATPase ExeA
MTANRDLGQTELIRGSTDVHREQLLPSRRQALQTLRCAVVAQGSGPVLLTGEPGTGKSWLYRRLIDELPTTLRSISVAMSEALDALDFLRLIGHGLGIEVADRVGSARLSLSSALGDESYNGRSWLLAIENAQDASAQIWSEVVSLVHDMESSRGFGSMVLVGSTELARMLSTRPFAAIASRLGAHAHLLPLDLDEARDLLGYHEPMAAADLEELEKLHRDQGGNPRRILRLWRKRLQTSPVAAIEPGSADSDLRAAAQPAGTKELTRDQSVAAGSSPVAGGAAGQALPPIPRPDFSRETPAWLESTSLVPSRPPLRVEEELRGGICNHAGDRG